MKKKKTYDQLTAAELAEATKGFERPFAFEKGRPLNACKAMHRSAAVRRCSQSTIGDAENLDHFFTPEIIYHLDQISAEIKAGGKIYSEVASPEITSFFRRCATRNMMRAKANMVTLSHTSLQASGGRTTADIVVAVVVSASVEIM